MNADFKTPTGVTNMADTFDVAVIGGGPGGYAAAIRCAEKGASGALFEKKRWGAHV
jgi:pyruvate/2-oxoglutarate dehydrogenase complex dihydrolipoamide dehydrogenase (E3) component